MVANQREVLSILNKGCLQKMHLFRHFDNEQVDVFILDMYKELKVRTFPAFSWIANQGDRIDGLYLLHQGIAQVSIVPPREEYPNEEQRERSPTGITLKVESNVACLVAELQPRRST